VKSISSYFLQRGLTLVSATPRRDLIGRVRILRCTNNNVNEKLSRGKNAQEWFDILENEY